MAHEKVFVVCEDMCMEEGMTKEQINSGLSGKSNTNHNHDGVYSKLGHVHTKSQITDFAHNHDERYYTEAESDARYKLQGDFAILTGSTQVTGSSKGTVEIDYPTGFTVDNCVAISFGIKVIEKRGYNYEGIYTDSEDSIDNCYRRRLNLNSSKVKMVVYNPNTDAMTVYYKIVLMKIS